MKHKLIGLGLVGVCVVLTSCFFYKGYPKQWAPREKSGDKAYPEILGTYSDEGKTSDKNPQTASLSRLIFARGYQSRDVLDAMNDAKEVKFARLDDDTLAISVWNEEKELYGEELHRSKKGFSCSRKGLRIKQSIPSGNGEGYSLNFPWGHLNLAVNKEHALVVEMVENAVGTAFFIIPYAGGGSKWFIFNRLDTPGH